ncbi:Transcriptional regulatory protein BtsR [Firmicutes bacterium ASF500]|nr:Transcriptional regulatory protein BtsR [Firmicutes bacterium ASF500]
MYRIAVCDDDPVAAEQNRGAVCRILSGQDLNYTVDVFHAPAPLLAQLEQDPDSYQLLLLDIQFAGENGVDAAALLRDRQVDASIIYITDHPAYALDSFPTYPLEFLVKPVDEGRLAAALSWDRLRRGKFKPMRLNTSSGSIPLEDILYLEISGRKTAVHTTQENLLLSDPLSKLEEPLLGRGFCHSHFSFLVNLSHVQRVDRACLTLDNGETIPVSRRYYQSLMNAYIDYLKL